jgi:hypothetical protein
LFSATKSERRLLQMDLRLARERQARSIRIDLFPGGHVRSTFYHMRWPFSIPADLRNRLAGVLSTRHCGPPEVWGEIRDWLEEKGAQVPEGIELEKPPEGSAQRDQ